MDGEYNNIRCERSKTTSARYIHCADVYEHRLHTSARHSDYNILNYRMCYSLELNVRADGWRAAFCVSKTASHRSIVVCLHANGMWPSTVSRHPLWASAMCISCTKERAMCMAWEFSVCRFFCSLPRLFTYSRTARRTLDGIIGNGRINGSSNLLNVVRARERALHAKLMYEPFYTGLHFVLLLVISFDHVQRLPTPHIR